MKTASQYSVVTLENQMGDEGDQRSYAQPSRNDPADAKRWGRHRGRLLLAGL
jgi:rRNA maturation protein Nop10